MLSSISQNLLQLFPRKGRQLFYFFERGTIMINNQLEKLQNDSAELQIFADRLSKEGNYELVKKIIAKREYLNKRIETVYGELVS